MRGRRSRRLPRREEGRRRSPAGPRIPDGERPVPPVFIAPMFNLRTICVVWPYRGFPNKPLLTKPLETKPWLSIFHFFISIIILFYFLKYLILLFIIILLYCLLLFYFIIYDTLFYYLLLFHFITCYCFIFVLSSRSSLYLTQPPCFAERNPVYPFCPTHLMPSRVRIKPPIETDCKINPPSVSQFV